MPTQLSPIGIFEDDGDRLASCEALENLAYRLEGVAWIAAAPARQVAARRRRHRLPLTRQFRQEPAELVAPAGLEALEDFALVGDMAVARRIDPGREWKDPLA